MNTKIFFIRAGALLAALAVILGAFGAHTLQAFLSAERLETYHTGVQYQMLHALGLLLVAFLLHFGEKTWLRRSGWLFLTGILLFSGSLYVLSLSEWLHIPTSWIGPITPFGGVFFILGWIGVFLSTFRGTA